MPVTATSNSHTGAHTANSGVTFVFPDVCVIPAVTANMTTPLPYPSFAGTALARQKQKVALSGKAPVVQSSTVTKPTVEAGSTRGGVTSKTIAGKTHFVQFSFDVKHEGNPVVRHEVTQLHNALTQLNAQLQNITSSDPNFWQRLLQEYIVTASALYMTLKDED
jgi:hypothetical protein